MKDRQVKDELTAWSLDPVSRRSSRFWLGWGLALAITVLLVVLVSLPPFVGLPWRVLLMQGFSTVCHQLPDRSPSVNGIALAVCHRCYGIYWGLALAVAGFLVLAGWDAFLNRYAPAVLALALVPTGLDWFLGVLGIWDNTPWSRLITGGLLGIAAGYYVARALAKAFVSSASTPPEAAPPADPQTPRAIPEALPADRR